MQVLSTLKDMDALREKVAECQAVITRKEAQVSALGDEWTSSKEKIRALVCILQGEIIVSMLIAVL